MELYSIIDNFRPKEDGELLRKADALKPVLFRETVRPVRIFYLKERYGREFVEIRPDRLNDCELKKGDNLCFDFGEHCVGYLKLLLDYVGCHPDAPAYIKLKFAERMDELSQCSADYSGWLSKSWIQEEYIHLDELPCKAEPARRFAFRFLKITVLDTSKKYSLKVQDIACETETSADPGKIRGIRTGSSRMDRIYDVGISTLKSCMQEVFEDGPKRDRRLWVGDLRLEALASYAGIPNTDLVKRCLYLFAGSRFPDGRISAGIFTKPKAEADDTWFFDYALLYVVTLEEYLEETGDQEALTDLYSTAMTQIDLAASYFSKADSCIEVPANSIFIDWCENLDKAASAQAVLIYAIGYAVRLAERMKDTDRVSSLLALKNLLTESAAVMWDDTAGCYLSNGQRSVATQVWMVLAGVPGKEQARELMGQVMNWTFEPRIRTPYMQHYYIMALLKTGFKKEAAEHMMNFWGSMIDAGADTYYEIWDPEYPDSSPYGGKEVLSFCHAWSCTPVWLIRNYFCSEPES